MPITPKTGSLFHADSHSWRVDETYVRVKGRWKYLYRAIDKEGATLDFYLADRRNAKAAKRFLAKALRRSRDWIPRIINTDVLVDVKAWPGNVSVFGKGGATASLDIH